MAKYQDGWYWVQEYEGGPWDVRQCIRDEFEDTSVEDMHDSDRDTRLFRVGPRIPAPDEPAFSAIGWPTGLTGEPPEPEPTRNTSALTNLDDIIAPEIFHAAFGRGGRS